MGAEGAAELFSLGANPLHQCGELPLIVLRCLELLTEPFHPIQAFGDFFRIGERRHASVSDSRGYLSLATTDEVVSMRESPSL